MATGPAGKSKSAFQRRKGSWHALDRPQKPLLLLYQAAHHAIISRNCLTLTLNEDKDSIIGYLPRDQRQTETERQEETAMGRVTETHRMKERQNKTDKR